MLPIEQALNIILEHSFALPSEAIGLLDAPERILREKIIAPWNFPRFSYSAMDGYAVLLEDVLGASNEHPVRLKVTQEIRASQSSHQPITKGECATIFTGAEVPPNCDAIIMLEHVERDGEWAIFRRPSFKYESIRLEGIDARKGAVLLDEGTPIGAGEVGLLASIRRAVINVAQRPRVAILSCGDELMELHEEPEAGKIIESNRFALAALVKMAGGIPQILPITKDDPQDIRKQILAGLRADILISSGGVSLGDYDLIRPTMEELGVKIHFWKVSIKPGKPVVFGSTSSTLVFGLPGNPISAMVTFELFVRPTIRKIMGAKNLFHRRIKAVLTAPTMPTKQRYNFVRGHFKMKDNQATFTPLISQSSGNLLSMKMTDALAILSPGKNALLAGEEVDVVLLSFPSLGENEWLPTPELSSH